LPDNVDQLRVQGLTPLQLAELEAAFAPIDGDHIRTVNDPSLGGGKLGEPTLITAIIVISPPIIAAVAMWLAKQRSRNRKILTFEKISPSGDKEVPTIDERSYSESESPLAAIQTFLKGKFGYDPSAAG
jgi:hypothetical protein